MLGILAGFAMVAAASVLRSKLGRAPLAAAPGARTKPPQGTSGGPQITPGAPILTPGPTPPSRNDFPGFSALGGYTGGNIGPKTVEAVLLDPGFQGINTTLLEKELNDLLAAPHAGYGQTDPAASIAGQTSAQTPENFDGQDVIPPRDQWPTLVTKPSSPIPSVFKLPCCTGIPLPDEGGVPAPCQPCGLA